MYREAFVSQILAQHPKPQAPSFDIQKIAFERQLDFIVHPSKLKALFCTRRAAKSYTGGLYLVYEALRRPFSNCLYLGLTRLSAKGIVWNDILKDIELKNNLGMEFNNSELVASFPNGSKIHVTGADSNDNSMEKLLGKKWALVIIDEAASFTIDLRRLVYGILKPATVDYAGTICLLGTSGNLTEGLFFDVTNGKEAGWHLSTWTAHDNPFISKLWQEELQDIRLNRPAFMETPLFKQWYLNHWVIDEDALVYRYKAIRNEYEEFKHHVSPGVTWSYVLGVDLGYDPDPSAFVVVAFNQYEKCLYILESFKQKGMDITSVAHQIRYYQSKYALDRIVIDGANKQAVMEIVKRHDIPLTASDKTAKVDFIQIMNAEFIQGNIKISPLCDSLKREYEKLIWDDRSLKKQEHPNCDNHCTDAALYAWRFCYQFLSKPYVQKPDLNNKDQYMAYTQKIMEENLQKQIDHQKQADEFGYPPLEEQSVLDYYLNKKRR